MRWRRCRDLAATKFFRAVLLFIHFLTFLILAVLFLKSVPILQAVSPLDLFFSRTWHPLNGSFGFFPFIVGSVGVTVIAMILAIPVCLLSAIYLAEYTRKRVREWLRLLIDILAGIPSVIYGLFGVIVIVPVISALGQAMGNPTTGYSILAGGIILAIMVIPFIISVTLEVLLAIPMEARESVIALGTTKWESIRHVILKIARQGIIAAVVLGFARAFGETIAVMMVVGNVARVPVSLFDPAYPLPALIANNYGEMMSIPMYDSAMLFAALVLMLVVGGFSLGAHLFLLRLDRKGV